MFAKFYSLVKITFLTKFAYVKAFWFNMLGTLVSIVVYYFLWGYVFREQDSLAGLTMAQMTTYVILSRMLSSQFGGGMNKEFARWVYDGAIGVELLRPVSLFFTLFGKRMGEFFFFIVFKGIPVSLIGFLLLGGTGPAGGTEFLLFLLSVFISIGILFFLEFMVGMCSFYTVGGWGLDLSKSALLSILSGGIVPIFLFPEGLAKVLNYMPFAGMVATPLNLYLGRYTISQGIGFIGIQIIWIMILGVLAKLFYNHVIKRVVVQGG